MASPAVASVSPPTAKSAGPTGGGDGAAGGGTGGFTAGQGTYGGDAANVEDPTATAGVVSEALSTTAAIRTTVMLKHRNC
ncbi:hypothetical protein GCM10023176_08460 [Micromonospora coerulea]|uniref:Uncharacterized protein n=1 Tax=Micromonospora coerulea TaxID=47856 RepID=A0ABP8S924_9ACTN